MGGGVGIALPVPLSASRPSARVLAMPETTIGLFPDVGGGWYLSRLPGRARRSSCADRRAARRRRVPLPRLATHYLPSDRLEEAKERIIAQPFRTAGGARRAERRLRPRRARSWPTCRRSTATSPPTGSRTSSPRSMPAQPKATTGPRREAATHPQPRSPMACKVTPEAAGRRPLPAAFRRRDADGICARGPRGPHPRLPRGRARAADRQGQRAAMGPGDARRSSATRCSTASSSRCPTEEQWTPVRFLEDDA